MIHQDAPHDHSGNSHELRPVPPVDAPLVDEPEIRFVDERGRLERMVSALRSHVPGREAAQLRIDQRQHFAMGCLVAVAPLDEQVRNPCRRR